jgi:YidC/Oxa1 family membrane protein insertase
MDRRFILAIVLLLAIALAPSIIFKRPSAPGTGPGGVQADSVLGGPPAPTVKPALPPPGAAPPVARPVAGPTAPSVADTTLVSSGLYTYGISTHGGRLVTARLADYRSTVKEEANRPLELLSAGTGMLDVVVMAGNDTISLRDWDFTASAHSVTVQQPQTLTLTGQLGGRTAELTYRFSPDDYRIDVSGKLSGVGPNGGLLLLDLGNGIRNTEADSAGNFREAGIVTKQQQSKVTRFSSLKTGETTTLSGPFEWVAVKTKYFVIGVLQLDSTFARISGVALTALPTLEKRPHAAQILVSLPVGPDGVFRYTLYAGPMEYKRLAAYGSDFDDVNPYGWPGFRVLIRFFAAPVRWLLVEMHTKLNLAYGIVLILFGIMIRLLLWPLNQKAMRSTMRMQEIQPLLKDIQERYKNDPQKLNTEMFKLYKEHNVNPLGGCWPMLLPWPFLLALFVVFQYSIELRGASFLWMADLSMHDPYYILPVLMGLSIFGMSKLGQLGMAPNPQMQTMLYVMPVMMTVLFAQFPAGLNLYYTIQNLASIPQQWMIAQERLKRTPPVPTKK